MKRLFYLLIMMLLVVPALAQEDGFDYVEAYSALTPPTMVYSGPDGHGDGVVGAIPATVDVSALGGAVYSMPIKVPEGINGMHPDLSVVYNSQSGNGLLGWGWNLGGLSAITRVGSTMYHDSIVDGVDFDEFDRFALDGQRLVLVNNVAYGNNGAEYKTEVDGMNKIVSYKPNRNLNGPLNFKVWTPEGLVLEYGSTLNSRLQYTDGDYSEVALWLLRTVTDRNGNCITYEYNNDGESVTLNTVYYTSTPDSLACYSVTFDYTSRNDVELSFIGNHAVKQKDLLECIHVRWWGREMWRYDFSYETGTGFGTSDYYNRLSSITLTCGEVHYNPTQIVWGERPEVNHSYGYPAYGNPSFNDYTTRVHLDGSPNGVFILTDDLKYPGDFNGDGLTDFISVQYNTGSKDSLGVENVEETRDIQSHIRVYLNKGNTKTDIENGWVGFDSIFMVSMMLSEMNPAIQIGNVEVLGITGLKWVYVCDFNGDGLDDFILHRRLGQMVMIHAFKAVKDAAGGLSFQKVLFNNSLAYVYDNNNDREEHVLVGDFMGRGRQDIILVPSLRWNNNPRNFLYLSYKTTSDKFTSEEANSGLQGTSFNTGDFNGDGITEIWYALDASGNNGKIVRIYKDSYSQNLYSWTPLKQNFLSTDHTIFTGDFNGDGKTDLLTYNKSTHAWIAYLFKTNDYYITSYDVGAYLGLYNEDPGSYENTIEERINGAQYFFQIADINGDGKSDVLFIKENNLHIAYAPLYYDNVLGGVFSYIENYIGLTSAGLVDADRYTLGVGDFLGQGSASVFVDYWLYSKAPMPTYYSVDSITDGLGNNTAFTYGYLVYNPEGSDNIFSLSHQGENLGLAIYNSPLPIRALKSMAQRNLYSDAPATTLRYGYANALIHRFGRGFLGFSQTTMVSQVAGNMRTRSIREYGIGDMENHPFALLKNEITYGPAGSLVSECNYTYLEYVCASSRRNKVFFPAIDTKIVDSYDIATEDFWRRTIEKTTYSSGSKDNNTSRSYNYAVLPSSTVVGVDASQSVSSASQCEFQTLSTIDYETPDIANWVVNRPNSVRTTNRRLMTGDLDIATLTEYDYGLTNPFLVRKTTVYPGADDHNTNGLAYSVSYEYDGSGNVTKETLWALNNSLDARTTEYEYERLQTPMLERNTLGYETQTDYNYYWELKKLTDCNGLVTNYWYWDHLGSTNHVKHPDGTYSCSAKRWAFDASGNRVAYAPSKAAYYTWDRSTAEPPVIVFFDASGRELRKVTEDMDGNAVIRDMEYDSLGNVKKLWDPCYWNLHGQYYTEFSYDLYQRPDTTFYPDGTFEVMRYASAPGTSTVTATYYATNGASRTNTKTTNVAGWTTQCTDNSGAIVYYSYYADGKLKKADLNPDMEIQMQYDDAGNRTSITDPDYGQQISTYNAFGELTSSMTPKGDVIEYRRDVLGRVVKRYDRDLTNHTVDSTIWVYGETVGEKGLLKNINFNNSKQVITYLYDTLCRPVTIGDVRNGNRPYQTSYGYDANGRINQITYPTGYSVTREYLNGRFYKVKDSQGNMLWQTLRENANGQIVSYKTGNLVMDSLTYDDATHLLLRQYANKGSTIIQNFTYTYDDFYNLATRTEGKYATPMTETFRYDNLDRLDTVLFNNTVSEMVYDAYGRMLKKTSEGDVVFRQALYNNQSKPHAVRWAEIDEDVYPNVSQSIAYTMHDKVKRIEQGDDILTIDYGYDRQRIGMTEWIEALQTTKSKIYVSNCEYVFGLSRRQRLTYLTGPMGVFAVYEELSDLYKDGDSDDVDGFVNDSLTDNIFTGALYYLHRDHLGSVTTVTNANGAIVQELSYDAWGNLRNPYTWSGSFTGTPKFDCGYTGHEHLWRYGLINMNGRVYDPVMSSFLSVDTYVQDPENPQNFNRYAYCLNNPLKYTDPDGELFWIIPNIGYSKEGGLSFGLTFAVGLPGLWSAQASVGYAVGSQTIYGSVGATFAGVTGYVSAGYSFKNEQSFASLGITAGLSPYSGVPVSTNFLTAGASCDFTFSKTGGTDVSFTGQLSAWSYNSSSKDWHYNPSVSVMVFPEHTTNFFRGQGFRSNDKVLQRFVSNNQHQQALDYFGFEGKYRPEIESVTSPGSDYWGATNRETGAISFGKLAFEDYATLYGTYIKESWTSQRIKSGLTIHEVPEELKGLPYETYLEEIDGYIYAYKQQGLFTPCFSKNSFPFRGIEYYQTMLGWVNVPCGEYPKTWEWLYRIPRKW